MNVDRFKRWNSLAVFDIVIFQFMLLFPRITSSDQSISCSFCHRLIIDCHISISIGFFFIYLEQGFHRYFRISCCMKQWALSEAIKTTEKKKHTHKMRDENVRSHWPTIVTVWSNPFTPHETDTILVLHLDLLLPLA